jgi:myo-inositol-1-phosphate synthase
MEQVRIAIVGVGNCASALVQGIHYYRSRPPEAAIGLSHWAIGGYEPGSLEIVAAFDVDARKVGRSLSEAVFAAPNCARIFEPDLPVSDTIVRMGRTLDGIAGHMADYPAARRFEPATEPEADQAAIVAALREAQAEILVSYLPVGSEQAARFYAECALEAGTALVNCMPVFLASDPDLAARFAAKNLPMVGDDIKSQVGATVIHRTLAELFARRGAKLDRTYQLNTGGNTDFLNMLDRSRLASKKTSKTEAVQSATAERLPDDDVHIGPSDYVPWQEDNKVCFLRMEGRNFGDQPIELELRLSVQDSPNSAGVAIDAIRCAKLALDRGLGGPLAAPSACFMKHPPEQMPEAAAFEHLEAFIAGERAP